MKLVVALAGLAMVVSAQDRGLEVASVRPASFPSDSYFQGWAAYTADSGMCAIGVRKPVPSGNRLTMNRMTLCGLIAMAYDIQGYRISGAPAWMMNIEPSNYFDIVMKAEGDATLTEEQARGLLKTLLADRFQVKLHRETKALPVYELTIGKNGTKLKEVPLEGRPERNGVPMSTYITLISNFLDRPLVDKTGLTGQHYQYRWDDQELREQLAQGGKPAPSIFGVVEEQLGLSLKAAKQEIDVLVIDRAEKPSQN